MAYFSALGGTGGTSATITVTYSEDFYGLTITATNGTTTLTKTATSSGTLVFDVSEGGTWVVSGTVEGATYSESVDVTFEYTAPPLVALPDGSTALPVNDIQMWLKCAAIRDKTTYTTLSDVLGDTETLIALCADSNACDYMARSTNWASGVAADSTAMLIVGKYNYCAKALISNATWCEALAGSSYWQYVFDISVPLMTSDSAPSGVASSSGAYTNCPAYYAFDRNDSTQWQASGNSGTSSWLQYMFPDSVEIKLVEIRTFSGQNRDYIGTFQGSNDGSNWTDLASNITVGTTPSMTFIQNSDGYKYYRLQTVQHNWTADAPRAVIGTVQFYGRTEKNYQGIAIHSAVEDPNIYYMSSGSPVTLCGIASGDTGEIQASALEPFKNTNLTLYSSVAKDPTNLSNDYSKSIRITPNITEIYLMPIGALYWYGNECLDKTGGYTNSGYSIFSTACVAGQKNKNSFQFLANATPAGLGTPNMIDLTGYTKLKAHENGQGTYGAEILTGKNYDGTTSKGGVQPYTWGGGEGVGEFTLPSGLTSAYFMFGKGASAAQYGYYYAAWLE